MQTKHTPSRHCERSEAIQDKQTSFLGKFAGFTLVELIVVITILVILGTIAFINIGGYSGSARDSVRISNLAALKKGLDMYQIRNGTYPLPENPVNITASGIIIGYQGSAKDRTAGLAELSVGGTRDPSDRTMYTTYSVNASQNKMQVMTFLEDGSNVTAFVPQAFAGSDYSNRYPIVKGDTLGILLASGTLQPVQETGTGLDLVKTTTLSGYTIVFSQDNTTASIATSGTGAYTGALFTFTYHQRDDLLRDKTVASLDANLLGYWDMETLTGGLLKDWSGYGNDGTGSGGVLVGGVDGKKGKGTSFNGVNQNILIPNSPLWDIAGRKATINLYVNFSNTTTIQQMFLGHDDGPGATNKWFFRYRGPTQKLNVGLGDGVTTQNLEIDSNIVPNQWYNLSFVNEGNKFSMYIDGVKIGEQFSSIIPNANANFTLGNAESQFFSGSLDEVRIYNRALSDSEIQVLYQATK